MTLQELEAYSKSNHQYRKDTDPIEISLDKIRRALYATFGIKEFDRPQELENKIERTSMAKVTKEAKDAWIAAGMPSPAGDWFRNYHKEDHG